MDAFARDCAKQTSSLLGELLSGAAPAPSGAPPQAVEGDGAVASAHEASA